MPGMPKRKYDEVHVENESIVSLDLSGRSHSGHLENILEHGKKAVFRSLKIARGFERQKLGRRQKAAKENNAGEETVRLDAEVIALKSLDLALTAKLHLYKSLLKSKRIASAPTFPHYISAKVKLSNQPHNVAQANVQARLFNSNPVKTSMLDVMSNVEAALGVKTGALVPKKRLRASEYESRESISRQDQMAPSISEETLISEDEDGSEWTGFSSLDRRKEVHKMTNSDDGGVNYDLYNSRLAISSSDELEEDKIRTPSKIHTYNHRRDLSLSPSSSDSPETPPLPSLTAKPGKVTSSRPKSTTFLPSLMMGGYWSGSESAPEDEAEDHQTRKNRMGQQARRQLWEKRFGRNANHLKKENRDQGWDPRKGAIGSNDRGDHGRSGGTGSNRSGFQGNRSVGAGSGANSDPVKARAGRKAAPVEGALHPSWEAAKKAKEAKKIPAFQGKKVLFD